MDIHVIPRPVAVTRRPRGFEVTPETAIVADAVCQSQASYLNPRKQVDTMLPLLTPRLVLRRFVDEDWEPLAAYRDDPEVARYQSWEHCTPAEAKALIQGNKNQPFAMPGDWIQVAIALRAHDILIGDLAIKLQGGDPRQAIIGYTIARTHHRQGYASEAISALFDHLFLVMNLHRVSAECDTRNTGSWGLMEHLGMRREAHNLQSTWFKGDWADDYIYAILREEWLAHKGVATT